MDNYLELVPEELLFTIIYNLNEYDLLELEEIIDINYKKLFAFYYPEDYGILMKLFKQDKYIRKYRNDWEILYNINADYIEKDFYVNPIVPSIFLNINFRISIFREHPDYYKYLEILDKTFISDLHAIKLYSLIKDHELSIFLIQEHIEFNDIRDYPTYMAGRLLLLLCLLLSLGKLDKINEDDLKRFISNLKNEIETNSHYSDDDDQIYYDEIIRRINKMKNIK